MCVCVCVCVCVCLQQGRRVFREPEALIVKEGARVMSLLDGTSKMSKSDPSGRNPVSGARPSLSLSLSLSLSFCSYLQRY